MYMPSEPMDYGVLRILCLPVADTFAVLVHAVRPLVEAYLNYTSVVLGCYSGNKVAC